VSTNTNGNFLLFIARKGVQLTVGLPKYGLMEAVFQVFVFTLASYPAGRYQFSYVQIINFYL